ncbi:MAG: DNA replication complex GINS family protein [Thermoplasmatales archaeon]|jgi:DNA replication initiation complex subunit (GINS family)|nr:DNA replication complex GINS family protein [Candidatus Thermoplasmatota archaeon]MDA8056009.1 DNA replication complex GINS family protein [Thermoplasmatales archaeon]
MKGEVNESYLNALLRLEVKNDYSLEPVSSQFYKEARNYLESLKEKIETETVKKNSRQIGKLTNELDASEKNLKRIIELRVSKILKAKANNEKEELDGKMTPEEQIFFENIVKSVSEFSAQLEQGEVIIPVRESKEELVEKAEESGIREDTENKDVVVYILEEIKGISIMGKPVNLRKEDIVTLPTKYASIIVKQGLGKILVGRDD